MVPVRYKTARLSDFENIEAIYNWVNGKKTDILYIHGESGSGKTHLLCAICYQLNLIGFPAAYVLLPEIALELRNTMAPEFGNDEKEMDVIKKYRNKKIIGCFDDLAANKPSDYVCESLYAIINHRYQEISPSIYTSNLSISQIADIYGDRIASRLASGVVYKLKGNDRRIS